jgi:hypothetical protein
MRRRGTQEGWLWAGVIIHEDFRMKLRPRRHVRGHNEVRVHQRRGHQVVGGNGQGSTMFSKGLAEYSALTIMEKRFRP